MVVRVHPGVPNMLEQIGEFANGHPWVVWLGVAAFWIIVIAVAYCWPMKLPPLNETDDAGC